MRRLHLAVLALCGVATAAPGGAGAAPVHPRVVTWSAAMREGAAAVRPDALRATITRLVGFGTRHTLSDTASSTRGVGAARRWTADQFAAVSKACGGCLEIATPQETTTGERMPPQGAVIQDVVAVQRGASDPRRVVIVAAHIDSRATDVMNATSDAPGADDDGSGVAVVLEAARVLSSRRFPATIVYAVLSGEEQGLYGGKLLASYAKAQGWRVEAALNNDIVGNSTGLNGRREAGYVRVFSEGSKSVETPAQAARRRYNGGENDSPSRNLARFMAEVAAGGAGVAARPVYRIDRYGRGGDQVPLLEAGFPAVRLSEAAENYARQHQDLRPGFGDTIAGVDFDYLAKVARVNVATLAALAGAPAPPEDVRIEGAVKDDTTVSWSPSPGAATYRVWWRDTTSPRWEHMRDVGSAASVVLKDIVIDDWLFGVQALGADGAAGPVEFPGEAGAFVSTPAPREPAAMTRPDWALRRAAIGDAGALALVGAASFLETYAGELACDDVLAHCRARHAEGVYADWLGSLDHGLWLAQAQPGGAPIGYAVLSPTDIPLAQADDLELKRIYVLSRWHGAGLGRALMARAVEQARARGARRIVIGAYARNVPALAFYRRIGFETIGMRSFTVGATTYDDDVVMALDLARA